MRKMKRIIISFLSVVLVFSIAWFLANLLIEYVLGESLDFLKDKNVFNAVVGVLLIIDSLLLYFLSKPRKIKKEEEK